MSNKEFSQPLRKFWDVEQLADYLNVSVKWVYKHTRRNSPECIPHLKLGKYLRFNPESEAFQAWLQRQSIIDKGAE